MEFSPLIGQLIQEIQCLPGVGQKTAQRMALHLLEKDKVGGMSLAEALKSAITKVRRCEQCRTLCELPLCDICRNDKRDKSQLCIVEMPMDILAIEQAGTYSGCYFVLMGRLSPLDGIGPDELKLMDLVNILDQGEVKEVILATNPTVEGEATAQYITEMVKKMGIAVSRIAYGVPVGGELEYVNGHTLTHAFSTRQKIL